VLTQTIAHYRIEAKIGAGGMGEVCRAHDTRLGRDVAIKILPEVLARDADRIARFEREAKLLAAVNHRVIGAQLRRWLPVPASALRRYVFPLGFGAPASHGSPLIRLRSPRNTSVFTWMIALTYCAGIGAFGVSSAYAYV